MRFVFYFTISYYCLNWNLKNKKKRTSSIRTKITDVCKTLTSPFSCKYMADLFTSKIFNTCMFSVITCQRSLPVNSSKFYVLTRGQMGTFYVMIILLLGYSYYIHTFIFKSLKTPLLGNQNNNLYLINLYNRSDETF